MRIPSATREVAGQELQFIFNSLVELKLQVEELRRRLDDQPHRVEVIEVGPGSSVAPALLPATEPAAEGEVLYRAGMTMAEVERAAIEAALRDTRAHPPKPPHLLRIGQRTLYPNLKH